MTRLKFFEGSVIPLILPLVVLCPFIALGVTVTVAQGSPTTANAEPRTPLRTNSQQAFPSVFLVDALALSRDGR